MKRRALYLLIMETGSDDSPAPPQV